MTDPKVPEPTGYRAISAELRRIADALDTLPLGVDGPTHAQLGIQAGKHNDPAATVAVDAVALAVLGKVGAPREVGSGHVHHHAEGPWTPVHVSIYQRVPKPDERDAELARLRAELAELQRRGVKPMSVDEIGQTYSREADDPKPVSPAPGPAVHFELVAGEAACSLDRMPASAARTSEAGEVTCQACRASLKLAAPVSEAH